MNARTPKRQIAVAFGIAAISDLLSIAFALVTPAQWVLDIATAVALFVVLGRRKLLLSGLIMEAIPGLYVFRFWVLVVGAIAMCGNIRPQGPSPR